MRSSRRSILTAVGISALTGCISMPNMPDENLKVINTNQIDNDEFPIIKEETAIDITSGESLITEAPEENAIYIQHIVPLPSPQHEVNVETNIQKKGKSLEIKFTAVDTTADNIETTPVVQPTPHTIMVTFESLVKNTSIQINTIGRKPAFYTVKNKANTSKINSELIEDE